MLVALGAAAVVAAARWAGEDLPKPPHWVRAPFLRAERARDLKPLPAPPKPVPATPRAATGPAPFLPDPNQPPAPREIASGLDVIEDLAFSPDGRYLLSAGYGDYSVRVWDCQRGEEVQGVRTGRRPFSLAVAPDGGVLVLDVYGSVARFRQHPSGPLSWARVSALDGIVGQELALSPDGTLLASPRVTSFTVEQPASELVLLRAEDLSVVSRLPVREALRRPTFSPSGRRLAAGSTGNTFTVWDLTTGRAWMETVPRVAARSDVGSVAFSPDERWLATGHMDSSITIWDVAAERQRHNFYVPDASTWRVAFSPAGDVLASAQADGSIRLWDPETAKARAVLRGHAKGVREIAFSPDGRRLASYGEDGRLVLWEGAPAPSPPAASAPPATAPARDLSTPDILRLAGKVERMESVPLEQRQGLRRAVDRLPTMRTEERAALVAALLLLAAVDEMAASMRQALLSGGPDGAGVGEGGALTDWNLGLVPEAAPVVAAIRALRSDDMAVLESVLSQKARSRLDAAAWERVVQAMKRAWRDGFGGAGPGDLHVSYRGDSDRGVLMLAYPTHGLSRDAVAGSVRVPEVPVVHEDGAWRFATAPERDEEESD